MLCCRSSCERPIRVRRRRITSLIVRPRNPETDGAAISRRMSDSNQPPEEPGGIPLTLVVTFEGDDRVEPNARRWGARFMCIPAAANGNQLACNVDDWCSDVGFYLRIESVDRIDLDVLPDAGSVGELGNPCGMQRRPLGSSATLVTYRLERELKGDVPLGPASMGDLSLRRARPSPVSSTVLSGARRNNARRLRQSAPRPTRRRSTGPRCRARESPSPCG